MLARPICNRSRLAVRTSIVHDAIGAPNHSRYLGSLVCFFGCGEIGFGIAHTWSPRYVCVCENTHTMPIDLQVHSTRLRVLLSNSSAAAVFTTTSPRRTVVRELLRYISCCVFCRFAHTRYYTACRYEYETEGVLTLPHPAQI